MALVCSPDSRRAVLCESVTTGDWTNELIRLFKEAQMAQKAIDEQLKSGTVEEGMRAMGLPTVMWPTMGLEGPFGKSQHTDWPSCLLQFG